MKRLTFILVTWLCLVINVEIHACDCPFKPEFAEAIKSTSSIFSGTVLSFENIQVQISDSAWTILSSIKDANQGGLFVLGFVKYTIEIQKWYKGKGAKSELVYLYSPVASTACGYSFQNKHSYIVYADKIDFENESGLPNYYTTTCYRTMTFIKKEDRKLRRRFCKSG